MRQIFLRKEVLVELKEVYEKLKHNKLLGNLSLNYKMVIQILLKYLSLVLYKIRIIIDMTMKLFILPTNLWHGF